MIGPIYDNHFSPRSRRSHGRRCHKDAFRSNRLNHTKVTDIKEESREPHNSESVTVKRSHKVSVNHPFFKSSIHKVEVEVLVRE